MILSTRTMRTTDLLRRIVQKQARDADDRITLGEFIARLEDRAFGLGVLLFALPNAIPLGIPGISSVCAIPIFLFSLQMILGHPRLALPKWLATKSLSERTFERAVKLCLPLLKFIELFIRPRLRAMTSRNAEKCIGAVIMLLAFVIFLPIPFGNFAPAVCMCILAMGLLEKDGLLISGGLVASALTVGGMSYLIFLVLNAAFNTLLRFLDF